MIAKKLPNFPAYPFPGFVGASGLPPMPSNTGMSYRDYIAVKAMETLILCSDGDMSKLNGLPERAYKMADLMLNARG